MKQHTSVILFSEWKRPLQALSLEQKGRILDALLDFPSGAKPEFTDPMLGMAWSFMQGGLEENARKWDETRQRRAEAGRRGAEKRWNSEDANGKHSICHEEIANMAVSGSDTGSDSDSVSGTGSASAADAPDADACPPPPVPARFVPPETEAVKAYFSAKGGTAAQAERFRDFYESNGWRVGQNPMKSWQAAANVWMQRDREQRRTAPLSKAHMASRPPEEAAAAPDWLKDAGRRRALKKKEAS